MDDLGRRPGGLFNTVRLGLRLARAGGKVRMALVVVGATAAALMILIAFSVQNVINTQWDRHLERIPYHAEVTEEEFADPAGEDEEHVIHDTTRTMPLHPVDETSTLQIAHLNNLSLGLPDASEVMYLLGHGPTPPGVAAIPGPKQAYVSPALQTEINTSKLLTEAFAGKELLDISRDGVRYPDELIAYIGTTEAEFPADQLHSPPVLSWGVYYEGLHYYSSQESLIGPAFIFLLAPAVVLLATTTRLASSVRAERMAALRLVGISRFRTQLIAAIEASSLATIGVALAVGLLRILAAITEGHEFITLQWFAADFRPALPMLILVLLFIPVLTIVTTLVMVRKISASPLEIRRKAANPRPSYWRLLPLLLGSAILVFVVSGDFTYFGEATQFAALICFVGGVALMGIGIILAIPVLVRRFAGLLGRSTSQPTLLLAARRTQYEPAVLNRLVAGLVLVLFIATGGQAVILAFENTPQYRQAYAAVSGEHATLGLIDDEPQEAETTPTQISDIEALTGVTYVEPFRTLEGSASFTDFDFGTMDISVVVTTCSQLEQWGDIEGECIEGEPLQLSPHMGPLKDLTLVRGDTQIEFPTIIKSVSFEPTVSLPPFDLLISPTTPELERFGSLPENNWLVTVPADRELWNEIETEITALTQRHWIMSPETWALDEVATVRSGIWIGTGIASLIAVFALGITAIDNSIARRPQIAMQRAFGVSLRRVRRSQVLQALLPLAVGVPLAGAAGILAGQAYISVDGAASSQTYWGAIGVTLALAVVAAVLIALATLPAIGGKITGQSLRRE